MKIFRIVTFAIISVLPTLSEAGNGLYFQINNKLTSTGQGYPLITVHNLGGSSCWNDYGLADWNQYVKTSQSTATLIYTETDDCWLETEVRYFAFFAKSTSTAPWVRVSPMLFLKGAGSIIHLGVANPYDSFDSGLYSIDGYCDVRFSGYYNNISGEGGQHRLNVNVEGSRNLIDNCNTPVHALSVDDHSNGQTASLLNQHAISVRSYGLKVGQSKVIKLTGLDSESVWELDQCVGDAVTTNGVIPKHTARKVLPSEVKVTATKVGQEICEITGWHYPERSEVIKARIIFDVK